MSRPLSIFALPLSLLAATAAAAAPASAATGIGPARELVPGQVLVKFRGARHGQRVDLPPGIPVRTAAASLEQNPRVAWAAPNFIATVSGQKSSAPFGEVPNDPGPLIGPPGPVGGWVLKQWNFLPSEGDSTNQLPTSPGGINAVGAWQNLIRAGHPGAQGVKVAVLDTGIAYRNKGTRFRRSPDFTARQFAKGYDFVDDDWLPLDENGHGTHVAGTIGEKTNNGIALTGLAYRAKLMPVRVLDRGGGGRADDIANGIRYAVEHGADVINMSFNFGCGKRVPGINEELRNAYKQGVVAVASIGNVGSESCVSPPATGPHVIGVGGSTQGGCLGAYSLAGKGVDIVAPGGGTPVAGCPSVLSGPIYQVTLKGGDPGDFSEPGDYVGTSMAAAHVSGVAAMVLASGVISRKVLRGKQAANQVAVRLSRTSRSLGLSQLQQGSGLIDAALATNRDCQRACLLESR